MDEQAWHRVKRVFHEAMARPPAERYAFLDEACSGDATVRAEVDDLLAAHDDIGDPETVSSAAHRMEVPGEIIGRYKLLQRIGEGGFGVVYMAEQQEPVRRRVALKIIKPGMDTKQVIARFEAERQALAMMDHPNIATVLDAGATDAGRPYFVMELVKGVPITKYCDANNLGTSERLRLFIEVCHALQHAHQKGIIHRDIKPSNVMVTLHDGRPVPRVIDFGVAKATQQRLTEKTLFTAYGQFIGTPAYMSPEQAEMSGLDVDTRSDVYSLGVLLYELLVGATPFEAEALRSAAFGEMQRILKEVEPPRPSMRLSTMGDALVEVARHRQADPSALAREIRGDLDWIVMRALEKDRSRRYASASELAADIVRHADDEPILARPPSTLYRLRKLANKHRGVATATVVALAAIVFFSAISFWSGRVAQQQAAQIQEQSIQLQTGSILATAAAAPDPLVRALLLRELADEPELPGRLQVARDVANLSIPTTVLRGHPGWVMDVDFSPDGLQIATASQDGARIWRADGAGSPTILAHPDQVTRVTFSPDGSSLLTLSRDGLTRIWDIDGGSVTTTAPGSLAVFSPDGSMLAIADQENVTLRTTGEAGTSALLTIGVPVSALAFSADSRGLMTGHDDGAFCVWQTDEPHQAPVRSRPRASDRVIRVMLDASDTEGYPLATYHEDGTLYHWTLPGRSRVFRRQDQVLGDREIPKWHPEGSEQSVIFTGALAGLVERTFTGSTLAVDRESGWVVDGYRTGAARVWGPGVSGESLMLRGGGGQTLAADIDRGGARIVTGHADGTARVWSIPGDEPRVFGCANDSRGCRAELRGERNGPPIAATDAVLSPDGKLVATSWRDGTARIRALDGSTAEQVLAGHTDDVSSIAFSPEGRRVVTSSHDGTARIWDLEGEANPIVLRHGIKVARAVFSPDGSRVATASHHKSGARVWSADGEGPPTVLIGSDRWGQIHDMEFSPDGTHVVTAGPDELARIWHADGTGEPVTLRGSGPVTTVAFSPDGSRVAMGCAPDEVRIWRADGSGEPQVLREHLSLVNRLSFSPDGTRLVTASSDGTVRVFALDGAQETLVLRGHKSPVLSASFGPDGDRVISAGVDGTARLWRVTWPGLLSYFESSVRACLTPEERTRFLAESPAEADRAYSECEQRHGR